MSSACDAIRKTVYVKMKYFLTMAGIKKQYWTNACMTLTKKTTTKKP